MRLRFAITLLFLICLLGYQAMAAESVSCEDMPCCAGKVETTVSNSSCCEASSDSEISRQETPGCQCRLEDGGVPSSAQQKTAALFLQNLEFQNAELVLLIFEEEPLPEAEEKPGWRAALQIGLPSQDASPYAAFPNPRPSAP